MRPHLGRFTTTTTTSNYFSYLAFWPVNFLRLFASPTPPPPSSSSSSPTTTTADHLKRASWTHRKQELFSKSGYKRPKQLLDSNATGLTWTERVENQLNTHTHLPARSEKTRHVICRSLPCATHRGKNILSENKTSTWQAERTMRLFEP